MLTQPEEFAASVRKCGSNGTFDYSRWGDEGLEQMSPLWLLKYLPNMPASHIAIFNDLRGPNNSITHREAAGNLAIGEAMHTIQRGSADRMLAGATGTRVHPMKTVHAVQTEHLARGNGDPTQASRPFDRDRTGMVIGEGAATVVLEELEMARKRGAKIYAEVTSIGSRVVLDRNGQAHRDLAMAGAIQSCLERVGMSPDDVGHIHAHGLSTPQGDIEEARAIRQVLGDAADRTPIVAAKANFGNLGAGSGVAELIASVMALESGKLFPVLNYQTPDPECPIAVVTSAEVPSGGSFLNLSTTPQAQAAVLLVRAME
jgi:3-oxoacyl-[acyl-carrier-protein] synthase II